MSGNDNTSDHEVIFSSVGQLRELLEGIPSDAESRFIFHSIIK